MTQKARQQKTEKSQPAWHHCKNPEHKPNKCRQLKREKDQAQNNTKSAGNNNNNNGGQINSNSHKTISNNTNAFNTNNQKDRKPRPVQPPCETCGKTNHFTEKCYFGANAADRPPPRNRRTEGHNEMQQRNAQNNSDWNFQAAGQTLN